MYGQKANLAAAPVLATTGLAVSWYVFAAVTMLFLGVALFQLGRRPGKVRP